MKLSEVSQQSFQLSLLIGETELSELLGDFPPVIGRRVPSVNTLPRGFGARLCGSAGTPQCRRWLPEASPAQVIRRIFRSNFRCASMIIFGGGDVHVSYHR
jgi:hypothetical protein